MLAEADGKVDLYQLHWRWDLNLPIVVGYSTAWSVRAP